MNSVWVAWYTDFSEIAVFGDELECLRHAVEHSMNADEVPFGAGLRETLAKA